MKITRRLIPAALLTLPMLLTFPVSAHASEPKLLGAFGHWTAYTRFDGNQRICYAISEPRAKAPRNVNHGDVYFMVSNWQSGAATEQPSLLTGYPIRRSSPTTARVDNTKIPMFASRNEAFIEDGSDERRLVKSMRAGSIMRVQAMSQRGTAVTYNFSLKGVTAALKKAKSACQ